MGIFRNALGRRDEGAPRVPTDQALLLHAMLLVSGADGSMDAEELAAVEAFCATIPDLRGEDPARLMEEARKLVGRSRSVEDAVLALSQIRTDALRKKAFVLAAEVALASGDVSPEEERVLVSMQRVLGVGDDLARKVVEVLALKYGR